MRRNGKRFRDVCHERVVGTIEPLSWEEAVKEKKHLELLFPENLYVIEEVRA